MSGFSQTILGLNVHVLFGADWCTKCAKLKTYANQIGLERVDVDVDDNPEIADICSIGTLPTLQIWSNGWLLYTSDAADELLFVDLGGRRVHTKKNMQSKK